MTDQTNRLGNFKQRSTRKAISRKPIRVPHVLNETPSYPLPSFFSRGMRLDIRGVPIPRISGTASIDEHGCTIHGGDFRAQTRRTYQITKALLESEGPAWKDAVRTTCYLRDIGRDYAAFNEVRTGWFRNEGLNLLPASTGTHAVLCQPDLLIEIEALASSIRMVAIRRELHD